jgi:cobyrinic acid a,c-diamide synthase
MADIARLLVGAPKNGAGKTTIVYALLSALKRRGLTPVTFNCSLNRPGAQYHEIVPGIPCHTLDLSFSGNNSFRSVIYKHAKGSDIVVIGGSIGYYDGIDGGITNSSYHIANTTETPTVIVISAKGVSLSAAAHIKGFTTFRTPNRIAGVILNDCSERLFTMLRNPIEKETGLPVIGYFPRLADCSIPKRLSVPETTAERFDFMEKLERLGAQAEKSIDFDLLLKIAGSATNM